MENSFDWEKIQSTVLTNCISKEDLKKFSEAASDACRVTSCISLPIWSDTNVCKFIDEFVKQSKRDLNDKSEEQSTAWRQRGNARFQKRLYSEALCCYTQCVMTAPYCPYEDVSHCLQLAMAFGNRSAALYHLGHYELAIEECNRAMSCGYPRSSLYKVLQKKGQCLLAMGHECQAVEVLREALLALDEAASLDSKRKSLLKLDLEKLICNSSQASVNRVPIIANNLSMGENLTEPSYNIANASRSLDLQQSRDRGRYLVAEVPVNAGELVIKDIPYAVVLLPEYHTSHCHQCCRQTLNPIPCPKCTDVQYCSDRCLHMAQESHHWLECGLWNDLKAIGIEARLSLRLLLKAKCWCEVKRVTRASLSMTNNENWSPCGHVGHASANALTSEGMKNEMSNSSYDCVHHLNERTSHLTDCTSHLNDSTMHLSDSTPHLSNSTSELNDRTSLLNDSTSHLTDSTSFLSDGTSHLNCSASFLSDSTSHLTKEPPTSESLAIAEGISSFSDGVKHLKLDFQQNHNISNTNAPHHYDNEAQYSTEGTSLLGCGRDSCYRSDYQAVYHLMPHTENQPPQELVKMTMTAIILSKCIQVKMQDVPRWKLCVENDRRLTPSSATNAPKRHPSDKRTQNTCDQPLHKSFEDTVSVGDKSSSSQPLKTCGCKLESRSKPVDLSCNRSSSSAVEEVAVLLLRHMQQLKCNAHAVTAIHTPVGMHPFITEHSESFQNFSSAKSGASGQRLNGDTPIDTRVERRGDKAADAMVDTTKQVRVATAVYPTASLLNHACEPNVIASFDGAVLTMRATRNLEPGEEVLHCYGPHAKHMNQEDRQRALQEQYFFTCTCDACKLDGQMETCDWSKSFKCTKCAQPLMTRKQQKKVGWCLNQKCGNTQNLGKFSKERERAANLFKLAEHFMECKHIEECLGILHQCYNIQCEILYKHHKSVAETQDCLAKCYALMGDYKQSGKFLKLSLATVEKQFGSESIELANELQKLAQVLFNGGQVQDTLSIIDRGIKLLTLHYGANHRDVQELTQMRTCLLSI